LSTFNKDDDDYNVIAMEEDQLEGKIRWIEDITEWIGLKIK